MEFGGTRTCTLSPGRVAQPRLLRAVKLCTTPKIVTMTSPLAKNAPRWSPQLRTSNTWAPAPAHAQGSLLVQTSLVLAPFLYFPTGCYWSVQTSFFFPILKTFFLHIFPGFCSFVPPSLWYLNSSDEIKLLSLVILEAEIRPVINLSILLWNRNGTVAFSRVSPDSR